jgi:hypothetical protein
MASVSAALTEKIHWVGEWEMNNEVNAKNLCKGDDLGGGTVILKWMLTKKKTDFNFKELISVVS